MRKTALLPIAALCLAGCMSRSSEPAGPTLHETRSVPRDSAETLRASMKMGAGDLKIGGGASGFLQADFTYNVASWKPNVIYSAGSLAVEQPDGKGMSYRDTVNKWDLRLNDEVPTDLTIKAGAGDAQLDLGSVALRNLEVELGAGEVKLDLRGKPTKSYDVKVLAGAGETTVRLPAGVGISATTTSGLGEVKVTGLRNEGGHWVNDAYASAKVRITLTVKGGVGAINLIAE